MQKKVQLMFCGFILLCVWILWSSNTEMKNSLLIKKNSYNFMKDHILAPSEIFCKDKPFLLIVVTSYVGHVELRSAHRRAMPTELLKSMNILRIFLLAKIPKNDKYITQEAVQDEHNLFGDLLQGSFIENYRNLTYKHLMGLKWASNVCMPKYILKVDDDIVFNLESTHKFLSNLSYRDNLLIGYMLNNTKPRRNKENKWYVTQDEYSLNDYPPYLSGWYYITTPVVAARLCDEALHLPPFWIDDIYVTGILSQSAGNNLEQLPQNFWLEYYELLECCLTDMVSKSIRCDFVVGPNGGRNNLIVEFNKEYRKCFLQKKCTKRPVNKPLKKFCVVKPERNIFSDGQGEIQLIN